MILFNMRRDITIPIYLALLLLTNTARVGSQIAELSYIELFACFSISALHIIEYDILHVHSFASSLSTHYNLLSLRIIHSKETLRALLSIAIQTVSRCLDILNWFRV